MAYKAQTLADYLGEDLDEIVNIGENTFAVSDREYLVLTNEEADEAAAESIKESAWAFKAEFLSVLTCPDACIFECLQDKCENGNLSVLKLIESTCGIESFVEAAIDADGRGHFLAGYDNEEREHNNLFIYRIN